MVMTWRKVAVSELHEAPPLTRRTRWWVLDLECGHRIKRHVRYRKQDRPAPQGTRRPVEDLLPAPVLVRCEPCTAAARQEIKATLLDSGQDTG